MDESPVLVERRAGYHILTLNRPQRLNAFNEPMHFALAAAIADLLDDEVALAAAAAASARLADEYRWSTVAEPLLEFCRNPYRAPDLADPATRSAILARAREYYKASA